MTIDCVLKGSAVLRPLALAAAVALVPSLAAAQDGSPDFLNRIFGSRAGATDVAQADPSDVIMRLDRLEERIRQLTGVIEQLQFRNQQLEQALRRMQEDNEYRFQSLGAKSPPTRPAPVASAPTPRSDVFDPQKDPNAPGAPRPLGSNLGTAPRLNAAGFDLNNEQPPVGAPGGRDVGAPLDLSTLAGQAANDPSLAPRSGTAVVTATAPSTGALPAPPPRNPSATGTQMAATAPPSETPQAFYDLAYGYVLHRDYALAGQTFKEFLHRYPSSSLAADAHYWLGESLFQRQKYLDAAESFLTVSTNFERSDKAPDAMFRLGQSLAAIGEKEQACAAFAQIGQKYPRASVAVKQGVVREQRRVGC